MRDRAAVVAAAAVVVGVVLSGCDSTATGTPTPQPGVSTRSETAGSSSPPESDQLAPPVENPKNLRGIEPCQLLTQAQLTELTVTEPGEKDVSVGGEEGCVWLNSNVSIGLSPDTKRQGLDEAYRRKDNFDNFAETTVDGYPAVRVDFATQLCSVIVGVADDQTLAVDFGWVRRDPAGREPCEFTEKIAGMVLDNLPAA